MNGSTGTPSIDTGALLYPVWERIGRVEADTRLLENEHNHLRNGLDKVEVEQQRIWLAMEKDRERNREEREEINRRINRAILWLAIAASGVVFQLVRAKIGI